MIRASFEDVVIEKQRRSSSRASMRCASGAHRRRRARLHDFRRGPDDVRLGARERRARDARRHGGGVRARTASQVDHWIVPQSSRRARRSPAHEVREYARSITGRRAWATRSSRAWRPMAGSTSIRNLPPVDSGTGDRARTALPKVAEVMLGPFAGAIASPGRSPAICRDAFDFPAPLVPVERNAGPRERARAVSRADRAFKDFGARFLAAALARHPSRTRPRNR